jgi:hypothetical protein
MRPIRDSDNRWEIENSLIVSRLISPYFEKHAKIPNLLSRIKTGQC